MIRPPMQLEGTVARSLQVPERGVGCQALREWVALGAAGTLAKFGRHDREEHAVGRRVVQVVDPMGVGESIERSDPAAVEPAEAPVDVHVVHECVHRPVGSDPDGHWDQGTETVDVEAGEQPEVDDRSEDHRIPVIGLETGVRCW